VELSVLAAPMAGGPGTPELVVAAARAGSLGFLAGGYKTAAQLEAEIAQVRDEKVPFAVNLFAPNPLPVDREEFRRYAMRLQRDADRFGLTLDGEHPREDDDDWRAKLDVLVAAEVPLVSFTFGIPRGAELDVLRRSGAMLAQTVTSPVEAAAATAAGVDALVVQSSAGGGHWARSPRASHRQSCRWTT
jgi:NAD(P)H-dependent flavin oxidoreductase YrpB (nitropropane dioxygenase family)